ncbi:DUF7344 domain-containing protein [Halorarum halobium]|uniref:DUF7344 domain-containing protein n=1 Tax=Halorarum halobium TaxID=3075121 RepID=UPI0028ADF586|nr:hypothetical protein [Halobaculum sp. XH14]
MPHTDRTASPQPAGIRTLESSEVDELFDVLRHPRRRYLLRALEDADERPLDDLVADVVRQERRARGQGPDVERHDQVRLTMFHSHLPKLEDVGLVDCDYGTETVTVEDGEKLALLTRLRSLVDSSVD